jgi:hypothetical protein
VATVPVGGLVGSAAGAKGFPKSPEERQQLLQLRKQQMVEEARRCVALGHIDIPSVVCRRI